MLAAALEHDEQRDAARLALRGFLEKIVIPPGDELLQVVGNLGEMLTAAGARNGSGPAAVGYGGCGGPATSGTCNCGAGRRNHRCTMSELRYRAVQESLREERIGRLHEAPHRPQVKRQRG